MVFLQNYRARLVRKKQLNKLNASLSIRCSTLPSYEGISNGILGINVWAKVTFVEMVVLEEAHTVIIMMVVAVKCFRETTPYHGIHQI